MRHWMTLALLLPCFSFADTVAQEPVKTAAARWRFSRDQGPSPHEEHSGALAKLEGNYQYVPGLATDALRFDGYTTSMSVERKDVPLPGPEGFTVESWIALNTYPWNWVPIAAQEKERQAGFFLGIDAFGHVAFEASINGQWRSAISEETVPLKRWIHLAGTYATQDGKGQLTVFVNGRPIETIQVVGDYTPAQADLLIGRVVKPTLPFPEAEVKPAQPVWYSLDGLLGSVAIYDRARSPAELTQEASTAAVPRGEVLPWQKMPSGSAAPGRFGAFYTTLHYEDAWDLLRQVGPGADVVVRFDMSPSRLVFWQGTNYVPAWVSGDDKWYTDEFLEVWNSGCPDGGDCEPMSDKQARYSHVDILESNEVRAVVHWRYALIEAVGGKGAWNQSRTGWTDFADEYWTIYPDGVAVRKQVLHSANVRGVHEWQETIVLHQPGKRPEDDIETAAITLGNLQGATKTYTWQPRPKGDFANPIGPSDVTGPAGANMQMVNLKSAWKPFQIVPPEGVSSNFYNNEKSYFTFECWNHWPVAQIASSDRPCVTSDRPSHTSLSHLFWNVSAQTENTATKILMDGLTTRSLTDLVPLAKSWISPPQLAVLRGAVQSDGYDASQRAYVLTEKQPGHPDALLFALEANQASPVFHAAVLIQGWGENTFRLKVNGRPATSGPMLRTALRHHLEGTDLLIWIETETTQPLKVEVTPTPQRAP